MKNPPNLVIFDMDGTLIASESIAERVTSRVVKQELNMDLSEEEIGRVFRGRFFDWTMAELERRYGGPLPDTYLPALAKAYKSAIETDLTASVGVEEAIKRLLPIPLCVASNGEPDIIAHSLKSVGLDAYFDGHYFSARDVVNPKPAPDVFLLAAKTMGAKPENSVVVEDTTLGITGALAAGMRAIGYAGNYPESVESLKALGVPVITNYADLPALILQ